MASVYNEKKLRRFFVNKIDKPTTVLVGDERKHLAEVLRARVGEEVILCPNDGKDYIFTIDSIDKQSVKLHYLQENINETEPTLKLTAFIAMLKGDKTEFAVQKLTELGVANIVPYISEYTVKTSEKSDRLKRAAHEASKQCGRAIIPEVSEVLKFDDILDRLKAYDAAVFAYEGAYVSGKRLSQVIKGNEKTVALVIGPEGGFSEKEVEAMVQNGFNPVTLGKRILRAETAAVAGAAVIMSMLGEWE